MSDQVPSEGRPIRLGRLQVMSMALTAGGYMQVFQVVNGMSHFRAILCQPGEPQLRGEVKFSVADAIDDLERVLLDDYLKQQK